MMTSRFPEITDELLSAYIDNAVSESERALIEAALREDNSVAWRMATLRETVQLLRALPVLQAPRSFALTPEQVGQPVHEPAYVPGVVPGVTAAGGRSLAPTRPAGAVQSGRWADLVERWRRFWQAGSPVWRNAMATSMALLLLLVIAPAFLANSAQQVQITVPQAASEESAVVVFDAEPAAPVQSDSAGTASFIAPESPDVANELAAPAALPTTLAESAASLTMQSSMAVESSGQPETAPQAMEAARIASPPSRTEDPLSIPSDMQESMMSGYDAAGDIAAAPPVEAAGVAASSPMLGVEAQPSIELDTAPATEAVVAGAALAKEMPETLPSSGVIQGTEESAAGDLAADSLLAPSLPASLPASLPPSSTAIEDNDAAERETAERATGETETAPDTASGVALVNQPEIAIQQQIEAPTPALAAPATTVVTTSLLTVQLLTWLQLAFAGAVLAFGLLWWRSRSQAH